MTYEPKQRVRFRRPDGTLSSSRDDAIVIDEGTVVAIARSSSSLLPPGFLLGVAERESSLQANEIDQDLDDDGSVKGTTYGLCQVSRVEALKALKPAAAFDPEAVLTDPEQNLLVAAAKCETLLKELCDAAGVDASNPPRDAWPFVCFAYNAGLGVDSDVDGKHRALAAVQQYGLDWEAVKDAKPFGLVTYFSDHLIPYAEHVLARVDQYPKDDGGDGSSSSDDPAMTDTPLGSFDPYTTRKLIAAVITLALAYAIWRVAAGRKVLPA